MANNLKFYFKNLFERTLTYKIYKMDYKKSGF